MTLCGPRRHPAITTIMTRVLLLGPMTYCVSLAAVTVHFRLFKVITGGEDASASIIQTARRSVTHRKLEHQDSESSRQIVVVFFYFFLFLPLANSTASALALGLRPRRRATAGETKLFFFNLALSGWRREKRSAINPDVGFIITALHSVRG